jgi:hypothetical protein
MLISIAASIRVLRVVGLKSPMGSGLGGGDATSLPQQPASMVINIAQVPN